MRLDCWLLGRQWRADTTFGRYRRGDSAVRWSSGTIPTDKTFTGQRSESFGLLDYKARYYSPDLGHFIQADTLIPGPGNPLAWDRYAYVQNNPVNGTDPTGHCLNMVDGKLTPECVNRWYSYSSDIQQSLFTQYHITLASSGTSWVVSDKSAFAIAVPAMGNKLAAVDPYRRSASEVFLAEYGDLTFTARPSKDGIHYSCGYEQGGFGCYGGSGKIDAGLVTHELAYTFSNNNGRQPYTVMGSAAASDNFGNPVFGTFANGYIRTTLGFRSGGPPYMYHGPDLYPSELG